MRSTVFPVVVLLTAIFNSSASGQPSPNQPDMSVDASTVGNTITLLAKGLRSAYVFPDVGEKVAAMLEQRQGRGEYASVSSAKAFSALITQQMFDLTRDKHLRLLYSSQVVPQFPLVTPKTLPPPSPRRLEQLRASNYEFERVER